MSLSLQHHLHENHSNSNETRQNHEEIPDYALWVAILYEKWDDVRSLIWRSRSNGRKDALRLVQYNDRALLTACWNGAPVDIVQYIYMISPNQANNLDDIQLKRISSGFDSFGDFAPISSENESINSVYDLMRQSSNYSNSNKTNETHNGSLLKRRTRKRNFDEL